MQSDLVSLRWSVQRPGRAGKRLHGRVELSLRQIDDAGEIGREPQVDRAPASRSRQRAGKANVCELGQNSIQRGLMDSKLWSRPAKVVRFAFARTDAIGECRVEADKSGVRNANRARWPDCLRRRSCQSYRRMARRSCVERPSSGAAGLRPSEGGEVGRCRKRREIRVKR